MIDNTSPQLREMAEAAERANDMTADKAYAELVRGITAQTGMMIKAHEWMLDAMWAFGADGWHRYFYGKWPEPWREWRCAALRYLYPGKWQKFQHCKNKAQDTTAHVLYAGYAKGIPPLVQ